MNPIHLQKIREKAIAGEVFPVEVVAQVRDLIVYKRSDPFICAMVIQPIGDGYAFPCPMSQYIFVARMNSDEVYFSTEAIELGIVTPRFFFTIGLATRV